MMSQINIVVILSLQMLSTYDDNFSNFRFVSLDFSEHAACYLYAIFMLLQFAAHFLIRSH